MLSKFILFIIGWKIKGFNRDIPRGIIVMAPHTSYLDAIIGKIVLCSLGIKHSLLTTRRLFKFPLSIILRLWGCYPVGGGVSNSILDVVNMDSSISPVICPEGKLDPTSKWNLGFWVMAYKMKVPIILAYLDYSKKEAGIKEIIPYTISSKDMIKKLIDNYKDVKGKRDFLLPE